MREAKPVKARKSGARPLFRHFEATLGRFRAQNSVAWRNERFPPEISKGVRAAKGAFKSVFEAAVP